MIEFLADDIRFTTITKMCNESTSVFGRLMCIVVLFYPRAASLSVIHYTMCECLSRLETSFAYINNGTMLSVIFLSLSFIKLLKKQLLSYSNEQWIIFAGGQWQKRSISVMFFFNLFSSNLRNPLIRLHLCFHVPLLHFIAVN